MAARPAISFVKPEAPEAGSLILLTDKSLKMDPARRMLNGAVPDVLARAAKTAKFEGGALKILDLLAPSGSDLDRIVVIGLGEADKLTPHDWLRLGGAIGAVNGGDATLALVRPDGEPVTADQAATVALGITMRAYSFDKYKSKKDGEEPAARSYRIAVDNPKAAAKAWKSLGSIAEGVALARDLVNEPANALGPVEFADRLRALSDLGVEIEVLEEKALRKQKMGALVGVAQGSVRPPRVVVMRWNGSKAKGKPVAFVGKGVVFDTGGISMKPAAGMEDMKGDMGGAAAVAGLMHALAARKARVNAVGIVGLVENMPDGNAQRPGDIVTSMSGKTIEVLNTDAEGRLVLADLLTFVQRKIEPSEIIDLATLTGAIIVALGNQHAGLYANDDGLAAALLDAGKASGEKVWRMPLGSEYDKMIDSKIADMKNIGGRHGGSITAAQFLLRFVENDTPWAHLDIAGTAMGSPASETNVSWGSGFGVRLLDELVRRRYEDGADRKPEPKKAPVEQVDSFPAPAPAAEA